MTSLFSFKVCSIELWLMNLCFFVFFCVNDSWIEANSDKMKWVFCCYLDSFWFETWSLIILCHFKQFNAQTSWTLKVLTKFVSFVSSILLLFVLDFGSKYILHYYHPWILYTPHPNFKYMFFWGTLVLESLNLASSSFGSVMFVNV